MTRAILRRHGRAVKKRAEGCGAGAGGAPPPGGRGRIKRRTELRGLKRAVGMRYAQG